MKLIKRTYLLSALWLLPVLLLGSVFSFYMIQYITYEETDEFLTYEMDRLVNYHQENQSLPEYHKVADILPDTHYPEPFFKDTLLLEPGDNELVPHRELHFSISHRGREFGIVLRHLMPGRDDIAEAALLIVLGLMALISLALLLSINYVNRVVWKPFYVTLQKLIHFNIGDPIPEFQRTTIEEFEALNSTILTWLKKVSDDYRNNKEFNENASHELQTHLAVIRSNTEKLMNEWSGQEKQLKDLQKIYQAVSSLTKFQKSLLLLSKISNYEYRDETSLDLKEIITSTVSIYEEAIELRGIQLKITAEPCVVKMDVGLAEVMVNNLVKNAVKHNIDNGFIHIELTYHQLIIENSGSAVSAEPDKMLERFSRGKNGNIGIGLAIVKQICEVNHFKLNYAVGKDAVHRIIVEVG